MTKSTTLLVAAMMLAPAFVQAKAKKKKAEPQLGTIEIVAKVNDHWQQSHSPEVNAFWDNAAYFIGNQEAYELTGHARYLEYADKWARHNKWSGATETNRCKWQYKTYGEGQQHVLFADWQACFQTYLDMYAARPDQYKVARAQEVLTHMCSMREADLWWWVDALFMAMPAMSSMYAQTGNAAYLEKMYQCFAYTDSLLFDSADHLYYRDAKYIYPAHTTANGKKDFWARGNGWALAAMARTLADVPAGCPGRHMLQQRFEQLAAAAVACQQPQGYWTRSMLDAEQAPGPEASGTSLLAYGMMWGVNHGLLDRQAFAPAIDRAWQWLATVALQADGSVGYMQPIGERAIAGQQLSATSVTNFGTGAFLLAACERVRYDDASVMPTAHKGIDVVVANNTDTWRQEVVALQADSVMARLGISGGRQMVVTSATGQEVAYQLTHDGLMLLDASVRPHATATFTIKKGLPKTFASTCFGRMYPERVDDIAWENDRGAYRCYGPALQRTGEDAYGIDVWLKNTPDLVVEQRYYVEDVMKPVIAKLRQTNKSSADSLNMLTSYHYDHGHGLDCYKVGPTLGCGTPALMMGDSIVFPYCYRDYEILDNGPLRFTVRLTYHPATIGSDQGVVETRVLSLDKGSNFNKMQVSYDGLTKPCDVAAGVVIHTEDTKSVVLGDNYVQYADPTDNPAAQNFQIYVAALFPEGGVATKQLMYANPTRGNAGHALGIKAGYESGQTFTYYFGSAWSKYDCRSQQEWQGRIDAFMKALEQPLRVEY